MISDIKTLGAYGRMQVGQDLASQQRLHSQEEAAQSFVERGDLLPEVQQFRGHGTVVSFWRLDQEFLEVAVRCLRRQIGDGEYVLVLKVRRICEVGASFAVDKLRGGIGKCALRIGRAGDPGVLEEERPSALQCIELASKLGAQFPKKIVG